LRVFSGPSEGTVLRLARALDSRSTPSAMNSAILRTEPPLL
jgi:hypothetical protein